MSILIALIAQLGVETFLAQPSTEVGPWISRCVSAKGVHEAPFARCVATYDRDGVRLVWDRTNKGVTVTSDLVECPSSGRPYPSIFIEQANLKGRNSSVMIGFSIWHVLSQRLKDCPNLVIPETTWDTQALLDATDPKKAGKKK